jgi:hypothetical protein
VKMYMCQGKVSTKVRQTPYSRSSRIDAAAESEIVADGLELVPPLEDERGSGGDDENERAGARDGGDDEEEDADEEDADDADAVGGGCNDMAARYCSRNSAALMRGVYPVRFMCTTCAVTVFLGFSDRASLRLSVPMTGRAEPSRAEADVEDDDDSDANEAEPRDEGAAMAG